MAMQSGKSPLAGKMKGLASASRGLVGKPIEIRGGRLPAGINGGVAVLSSVGVGTYPEDFKTEDYRGRPCFRAVGVAKSPEEHKGQHVRGSQFFLTEPLFDTPKAGGKRKTMSDHVNFMREKLTGWGLDYDGLMSGLPPDASDEQALALLEAGCGALTPAARAKSGAAPVCFRYRTWLGKPPVVSGPDAAGKWSYEDFRGKKTYSSKESLLKANPYAEGDPLVNVDWEGACEFSEDGQVAAPAVEDATGEAVEEPTTTGGQQQEAEAADAALDEPVDLDALAAAADARDKAAQVKLDAIADALGVGAESGAANTYAEAVEIIRAAQAEAEVAEDAAAADESAEEAPAVEDEPAADEPWQPAPGEEYKYKPVDPKDRKKRLKAISVIVDRVYPKNETVTVKSNVTKKLLVGADKKPLGIRWDALEQA